MVFVKNYETGSEFVNVMQRKLWTLFLVTVYMRPIANIIYYYS